MSDNNRGETWVSSRVVKLTSVSMCCEQHPADPALHMGLECVGTAGQNIYKANLQNTKVKEPNGVMF